MLSREPLLLTSFVVMMACAPPPTAGQATPEVSPSPADAASTCAIVLETRVEGDRHRRQVVVYARAGGAASTLVLPDRCPQGRVALRGLPASFDVYRTCNAGPCVAKGEPLAIRLEAGEQRELARLDLEHRDAAACDTPLAPGHYEVSAEPPASGAHVCVVSTSFDVRAAPPPPPPRPPSPPAPAPYGCTDSRECVLFCPDTPGCCGNPCGCRTAVNKASVADLQAEYDRTCRRPPNCLAMGCDYRPAFSASCVEGRCVAGGIGD